MANYAYVTVRKLTSDASMDGAFKHNYRINTPVNANPELSHLNDEAVKLDALDYKDAFQKKLESLDYYKTHAFRRDGVRALELTLEYSPEASGTFDITEWKKANVEWLQERFGGPDGNNVVSVMFHYDEGTYEGAGMIHGHAIVIPADDRGHICAYSFIHGKQSLARLQTSYAKAMAPFGLCRGLEGQHMKHQDITKLYAKTAAELDRSPIPEQIPGEPDRDYADRLRNRLEEERGARVRQQYLHEKEIREIRAQDRTETEKDRRIAYLEKENRTLSDELEGQDELVREMGGLQTVIRKAKDLDLLNYGIQNHPDDELAATVSNAAGELLEWAKEQKKDRSKETTH